MAATPASSGLNDHLNPTDEKMLLHIAMVIALVPRNQSNIDVEWTAEQLKITLDSLSTVAESGLPLWTPLALPMHSGSGNESSATCFH